MIFDRFADTPTLDPTKDRPLTKLPSPALQNFKALADPYHSFYQFLAFFKAGSRRLHRSPDSPLSGSLFCQDSRAIPPRIRRRGFPGKKPQAKEQSGLLPSHSLLKRGKVDDVSFPRDRPLQRREPSAIARFET